MIVQVINTLEDELIIRDDTPTVLDLSAMTHLNSKFIGKMLKYKENIILYNLSNDTKEILKGCNLQNVFKIAKTMKEASKLAELSASHFSKTIDIIKKNQETRRRCIALEILIGMRKEENKDEIGDIWP